MDYSNLSDYEINKRVAMLIGGYLEEDFFDELSVIFRRHGRFQYSFFEPLTSPADAWPIIVENNIGIAHYQNGAYAWSSRHGMASGLSAEDKNPLRAAMIVFLMMQESANVPTNPTGSDIR